MKKGILIGVIVGVLLVLIAGFFILTNNGNSSQDENADPNQMVDCGMIQNPSCFSNRMTTCLPVTAKMMGSDGVTSIDMTILGYENETCHFQRKINNVLDLNCYFPKGNLTWDLIDQVFGNDRGLQNIVDDSCKNV
jgi:hypothetical protein